MVEIENTTLPIRQGFAAVFSNVGFLLLWLAQLSTQLADRLYVYVLMIIVFRLTHSNLGVSLPLLAFGIPSVLVAPWAGFLVDKLDRKGILVVSSVIRGLLILLIIPLIAKAIGWIFLVTLLVYTAAQFFAPAENSAIPDLVKRHDLIVANSLFMFTWMVSSVFGFGLGAPLVNFFAEKNTLVLSAGLYLFAAVVLLLLPLKPREPDKSQSHVWADILKGFEFIRRNDVVRYSLYKLFVGTMAIATLSLLAISYASDILKIGESNFGYLIIAIGVGMFVGMATLEKIRHYFKMGAIVVGSFLVSGLVLVLLSRTFELHIALFLIFLLGIGNIYITSTIQTILQHRIPAVIRGRVFGVQNMIINSAFTFPVVLFGAIADFYGILTALAILGWVVLLTGVAGMFLPKFRTA